MCSSCSTHNIIKLLAAAWLIPAGAMAESAATHDLNPLLTGFELPGALPAATTHSFLLINELGNVSLDQAAGNEQLQLDAEVQAWSLRYTRPLDQTFSMQLEAPWLKVSGGTLDGFIERWHRTFNLPNGNRAEWPRNRLLIQHALNGRPETLLQQSTQGIGDLSLRIGRLLTQNNARSAMLWLSVKLPTGNAARFTGSGATDVALSLSTSQQLRTWLASYQQLSLSYLGHGERLTDQQKRTAASAVLGSDLRLSSHWLAEVQLNGHSAVYDSAVRVLGNALQLSFGPKYQGARWQSSLMISEDLAVDTAPDVQFTLSLLRNY